MYTNWFNNNSLGFIVFCFPIILSSCSHSTIIHPQVKDIVETVYASGKIISKNEYSVFALSSGTITKKLVKEGDTVRKNQLLYSVKNDAATTHLLAAQAGYHIAQDNLSAQSRILNDLELSVRNAQVKLTNDSSIYFRLQNLWKENIGTKNNLDAAYTQYTISSNQLQSAKEKYYAASNELELALHAAQSQVADAQTTADNYYIRSESNGIVFQTFKEQGETVKPNDVVALLGDADNRIIKLAVDQQDIDRIKVGEQVLLKTDVTGDLIYNAVVTKLYPMMNEVDQTFRVDAAFTSVTSQPFIHSSVEANIIIQKKNNALVIPSTALLANDSVLVKQDGKTKLILVQTGIKTLDETEVLQGLNKSSEVILPHKE